MTTSASKSAETSAHTSLAQLFDKPINGTRVQAIEIPLIQRDYAQGRRSERVRHIRERFIAALCDALESQADIDLDFVFGDVVNGTLYPLDGQQRLTTLFLLHCYLAWHIPEAAGVKQPWHAFTYATRPGARAFCQFLGVCRPGMAQPTVSAWLQDQADYLPTWKHDPTIQGMLVVLDSLHQRYKEAPAGKLLTAWQRLINPSKPAILFHLLPIQAQSLDNTLYVKMNSRGRPLTEFENFKAELEALLCRNRAIPPETVEAFSRKIDTDWADLFWHYRGEDHLIDDEFMRYLRFLFGVLAWKRNLDVDLSKDDLQTLTDMGEHLLGTQAQQAKENLDWITQALDVWLEPSGVRKARNIQKLFEQLFTRVEAQTTTSLRIFNFRKFDEQKIGVNMFHACCDLYGTHTWDFAHTLLLYGVLLGCIAQTRQTDFQQRLRLLRNLIEASSDEIRTGVRNNMPALLGEVEAIMAGQPLNSIKTFNQVQVANEQAKREFLHAHPTLQDTLYRLEDHALLRGGLTVFDLDPGQASAIFEHRAAQLSALFAQPYAQVTGALLAKGNDGRSVQRSSGHSLVYLGASQKSEPWENLFRARKGENPHPTSTSLMALLDDMATGLSLQSVMDAFLNQPNTPKDWRYYMVNYEAMHRGESGCYVISPSADYSLCMLRGDSCDDRSNHYDPYLMALVELAQIEHDRIGNSGWPRCFPGYETNARYLVLRKSSLKVRCVAHGWLWDTTGLDVVQLGAFTQIATQFGTQGNRSSTHEWLTMAAQQNGIDTEDRIVKGATLLKALIDGGM